MEKVAYNRIKIALLERQKTGKWLSDQLGKSEVTISRWTKLLQMDVSELLIKNDSNFDSH